MNELDDIINLGYLLATVGTVMAVVSAWRAYEIRTLRMHLRYKPTTEELELFLTRMNAVATRMANTLRPHAVLTRDESIDETISRSQKETSNGT